MRFDLIATTGYTAAAALVITVVALAMTREPVARFRVVVTLTAWFVVVVVLGVSRALSNDTGIGTPGLGLAVLLPIVVMAGLTLGTESGRAALRDAPLPALIGVNTIRILGVTFLLLHAADRLPAPFAPVAGWGDIAVGVTAPLVAWRVARKPDSGRAVALGWNMLGLLDLLTAIGLGVTSAPGPLHLFTGDPTSAIMTDFPWLLVPGFLVPLLLSTHLALFARLADGARLRARGGLNSGKTSETTEPALQAGDDMRDGFSGGWRSVMNQSAGSPESRP